MTINIIWAFFAVIAIGIAYWLRSRPLVKNKQWRDFTAFSLFMLFAAALSVALIMEASLPNPADLLFRLSGFYIRWLLTGIPGE
ncbi:MAG TPA: hypothetical protein DCK76_02925 [Desulfotomaculum sp.]|nr:MAG: hypothetical protein XD84_1046 [Desulfotomaculum sp. 46_80]HAG10343.1 hypothetical protein [Desulfotomaculum sp.]HBY04132.1 hypothetical protein [Desulfotomaculum sp.]